MTPRDLLSGTGGASRYRVAGHHQKLDDAVERLKTHLPRSNDVALIVLKGHLLVEERLNRLLETALETPSALSDARLSFHQKLCLARALVPSNAKSSDLWDATQCFNVLRNKLAHSLEPQGLDEAVSAFLRTLEDPETPRNEWHEVPLDKRLKNCIAFLCGGLDGWRRGYAAAKLRMGASNT